MHSTTVTESSPLLTVKEVAGRLGRPVHTIYRWLKNGKIEGEKWGGVWRIHKEEIVRQLHARQTRDSIRQRAKKEVPKLTSFCPYCRVSKKQIKAGRNRTGTQRFLCQICGRGYTGGHVLSGYGYPYPDGIREQALELYRDGKSLRYIEHHVGVNHQTVLNWINASKSRPV